MSSTGALSPRSDVSDLKELCVHAPGEAGRALHEIRAAAGTAKQMPSASNGLEAEGEAR